MPFMEDTNKYTRSALDGPQYNKGAYQMPSREEMKEIVLSRKMELMAGVDNLLS